LPIGGFVLANVPAHGGLTFATQHDASLVVPHPSGDARLSLTIHDLLVVELAIGVLGYEALLGREDPILGQLQGRFQTIVDSLLNHRRKPTDCLQNICLLHGVQVDADHN
jgi:hypothetical protein